jgi:hypothetical protein
VAASGEALGRTELLAEGIYEAMITTAAGLIVAIPTVVMFNFIAARIDRLVLDMDAACMDLLQERDTGHALSPTPGTSNGVPVGAPPSSGNGAPVSIAPPPPHAAAAAVA